MKNLFPQVLAIAVIGVLCAAPAWGAAKKVVGKPAAGARATVRRPNAGVLPVPSSQKGCIVFVNRQSRLSVSNIAEVAAYVQKETRCKCFVGDGNGANVIVEVVDLPDTPALTAYPEEYRAIVNVAKMAVRLKGGAVAKFFPTRCRKEILRALCFACAAAGTRYPNNILAVGSIPELDLVGEFIPGDAVYALMDRLGKVGVTPMQFASYSRACREGWAPAPTNDYQKAIWDKVHQLPTEPIKILPEKKKVVK